MMPTPTILLVGCIAALVGLVACREAAAPAAPAAPAAEVSTTSQRHLRGLGELRLQRRSADAGAWTTITAADAQHAAWCGAKFRADATALGGVREATGTGLPGTVLELAHVGFWLLGLEGDRFHVVFAPNRAELQRRCLAAGGDAWQPVQGGYPAWLDCFDNAAVGFWVNGGGVLSKELQADLDWFREHRFTMCVTGVTEGRLVAPGVLDTTVLDWFSAEAARRDVPWRMLLNWTAPKAPAFVRRISPLPYIPDPDAPSSGAPYFESQSIASECAWEPVPAADPWILDARRRIAEHAARDPRFAGHHVAPEFGRASLLGLERVAGIPETTAAWRSYLRDELQLGLPEAARRHTGRSDAWRTWDEVPLPRVRGFVGGDPAANIDLRLGAWQGRADPEKAGEAAGWFDPARDPGGWSPILPNDVLLRMHGRGVKNAVYWMRREFTLSQEQADRQLYLHISRDWWHVQRNRVRAWVDGRPLADLTDHSPLVGDVAICIDVGRLGAGPHTLVLDTGGAPVPSFVFLSPTGRRVYPFLDQPLNQLWYDATEFSVRLRAQGLEAAMRATRQGDPDRPMKVMAPGSHYDAFADLFVRYGAYPHDTGQAGAVWAPWTTSPILARGGQHSSEPGGPADNAKGMRDMFCRYLMLGDDAVDIVFHNDLYRTKPELVEWIAANRRLLACIGKGRREEPTVAVLRSNRTVRLGIDTPYNWDITRGELQACGRTGQLVDLPDIAQGIADAYPVLFDAGTAVLDTADVAAIERYVRRGGTFIALHNTGMHAPGRPHAWPISALTGLRPRQDAPVGGRTIRFGDGQDLWPGMRGRSIDGWGQVLDWTSRDVTGAPLDLAADAGGVEAIATWEGGNGIAIARRRIGAGSVILLGSTFWRASKDVDSAFRQDPARRPQLDQLLTSLGVPRIATTADPAVWAERWRSKNGIFDLFPVVCMRTKPEDAVTGDVVVACAQRPVAVWEVSRPDAPQVASTWGDGRLTLPAVTAEPMLPRIFAAAAADPAGAPGRWLEVQARQWGVLAPPVAVAPPPPAPRAEVLPLIGDWSVTDTEVADGWQLGGAQVQGWRQSALGTCVVMGLREDAVVRAVRRIAVPAAWQGREVRLVFDAATWFHGINPQGRLWLDGQPLAPVPGKGEAVRSRPDASFNLDVTTAAQDGELVLAIEIDARRGQQPGRPAGVTGVFYLRPEDPPVAELALTAWQAGDADGRQVAAPTGTSTAFNYLETTFELPQQWPGRRLLLRAPGPGLNSLLVNNYAVVVTGESDRLDISGLVSRSGRNTLRWMPGGYFAGWPNWPARGRAANGPVPMLMLQWSGSP